MTWVDFVIAIVLVVSLAVGAWRGLVRETLGLVVWGAAFLLAWRYGNVAANLLTEYIHDVDLRAVVGYALIVVVVLVVGGITSTLIAKAVRRSPLSGPDHLLGALAGLVRGLFIVVFVLMFASLHGGREAHWWKKSTLVPPLSPLVAELRSWMPQRWLAVMSGKSAPPPKQVVY